MIRTIDAVVRRPSAGARIDPSRDGVRGVASTGEKAEARPDFEPSPEPGRAVVNAYPGVGNHVSLPRSGLRPAASSTARHYRRYLNWAFTPLRPFSGVTSVREWRITANHHHGQHHKPGQVNIGVDAFKGTQPRRGHVLRNVLYECRCQPSGHHQHQE
jgi:hypothetical protein